ncbi:ankyrin-1-like isoform X2 [Littorina saxatilis]|uniref:ankyrin-1-like isoform X2 n=1 Tax=Littorina saxatilis TaxID=31220 RepID=UPI0038B49802
MSPFANVTVSSFSASTFEILQHFVNTSSLISYQDAVSLVKEKVTAIELSEVFDVAKLANVKELSVFVAAGAVCFLTATGFWSICRRITRRNEADSNISKQKLLQLMKKAYLPGCTETIIEQLKKRELDFNEKVSPSGLTFFLCACLSGVPNLIEHMLKAGANVHTETREGDSALYLATYAVLHSAEPSTDALRSLIKAGCNVNKQNRRGYTPLHRAASMGNIRVIQYLLLEGHIEAASLLKLKVPNPYVWDVVEPHTPLHIKMGLQSPQRKLMLVSSRRTKLRNVFT